LRDAKIQAVPKKPKHKKSSKKTFASFVTSAPLRDAKIQAVPKKPKHKKSPKKNLCELCNLCASVRCQNSALA
jgi:hypothetical protein